jgi:hypothetical protein
MTLFSGIADPEGAVLLVRGALAGGDQARAVALAKQTQRLAAMMPQPAGGEPGVPEQAHPGQAAADRSVSALAEASTSRVTAPPCHGALRASSSVFIRRPTINSNTVSNQRQEQAVLADGQAAS